VIAGDDLKVVAPDIRTNLGLSENVEQLVNALDTASVAKYPVADLTLDRVGDLVQYDLAALLSAADKPRES